MKEMSKPRHRAASRIIAFDLLTRGHTLKQVAAETGIPANTIRYWATARGVLTSPAVRQATARLIRLSDDEFRMLVTSELKRRGLESP